jgi:multiple sugar transport system ATP-binding protein
MTMGDRVAVMRKGELQQVDTPQNLYDHPVNLFVGGFIGSPAMNLLEATLEGSNGDLLAQLGSQEISLGEALSVRPGLRQYAGRPVILGIRPEDLDDASLESDAPDERRLRGEVVLRESLGSEIMVHFNVDARPALTEDVRELARDVGSDLVEQEQAAEAGETTLVGRFGARSDVKVGDRAEVAVDTRALHFFDPETGLGIYNGSKKEGSA